MRSEVLLIDGLNLIRRIYAGVPGDSECAAHLPAAVTAARRSLGRALARHAPSHAICVLEQIGASWRHRAFADYKRGRQPMPAPLAAGLGEFEQAFAAVGVNSLSIPDFEADDVIATLANGVAEHAGRAVIVSTDKTFCQLVTPQVRVFDHFNDRERDAIYVLERYGVAPPLLAGLFALTGDTTVGVPGVKGIGTKTAADLIARFGDFDAVVDAAGALTGRVGQLLRAGLDDARLARRLLALRTDVELGVNLQDFRYAPGL